MSPSDFENLRNKKPEFGHVLDRIGAWVGKHTNVRVLEPARMSRDLPDVTVYDLVLVLSRLAEEGELRRVYRVEAPNGALADSEFESPRDIPDKLLDTAHDWFNTKDGRLVVAYRGVEDDR